MKIICIGRNYAAHARELGNEVPSEPVFFMKPDTAILRDRNFYLPNHSEDIHYEAELVVKIAKPGKFIKEHHAHKYYNELSIGIDFTARDIQQKCKEKGLPWEIAKAFDGSAPVGRFIPKTQFENLQNIDFKLDIDGKTVQEGNTQNMLFGIDQLIAFVSKYTSLKTGDLIFTGTPKGVGRVYPGNKLSASINEEILLEFGIK